jgi:hypothetical protein
MEGNGRHVMASSLTDTHPEVGVSTLVSGIVHDIRRLLAEQLELFQAEIRNDLQRAINAFIPLGAGVAAFAAGLFMLALGVPLFLWWLFPEMPLWVGFAIVGGVGLIAGITLFFVGVWMLRSSKLYPANSLQELRENIAVLGEQKENVRWKMKT